MKQDFNRIPDQITKESRFFPVGENKRPLIKDWSNPQNQRRYKEILFSSNFSRNLAGFDTTGHGEGVDYLFLDFDHVLDDDGNFVTARAEECYQNLVRTFPNIFVERSISRHGLHAFLVPTPEKFNPTANGKDGVLHLSDDLDKDAPKLELFYKTKGRYCLVTGDRFRDSGVYIPGYDDNRAAVDEFFQSLLEQIKTQNTPAQAPPTTDDFAAEHNLFETSSPLPPPPLKTDIDDRFAHANIQETAARRSNAKNTSAEYDDPPEYKYDFAVALLEAIDPTKLNDSDWLSVISSATNLGIEDSVIDSWNQRDPDRYNQRENLQRQQSLKDGGFGIENLIGKARSAGFDIKAFKRQWYKEHPEYSRPLPRKTAPPVPVDSPFFIKPDLWQDIRYKSFSNVGDAERLFIAFGDRIRYTSDTTHWGLYHAGVWNFNNSADSSLFPYARAMTNFIRANVPPKPQKSDDLQVSSDMTDEDKAKLAEYEKQLEEYEYYKNLAKRWENRGCITAGIDMLKGEVGILITSKDLDTHPNLLNVANGVVDLETGKLYPHSPELYLTRQSPVVYNPRVRPTLFLDFLKQILPDDATRAAVMRFLGYAITGDVREHKAMFIHGAGGNGKGTLSHVILKLLDDLATTLRFETFSLRKIPRDADAPTPEFSKLVGRRIGWIDEMPTNRKLDPATFKNLTGGDAYSYRKLCHESAVNDNPTHKLIFSGNYLPNLDDASDDGLRRRLYVVNFPQQFLGDAADKTLPARLTTQQELTGTLTLLVYQAIQWYKDGLLESPAMKEEKNNYLTSNDWLADFVAEKCVLGTDQSCPRAAMLACLADFKPARGLSDRTLTNMIKKLEGVDYRRKPGKGTYEFVGIGLSKDDNE